MTKILLGVAGIALLGLGLVGVFQISTIVPPGTLDNQPAAWASLALGYVGFGIAALSFRKTTLC